MEFRPRNYTAEEEVYSLPRVPTDTHPLSTPSPSHHQVDDAVDREKNDFYDPLRGSRAISIVYVHNSEDEDKSYSVNKADVELPAKDWKSFKTLLMQKFSGSKMVSISSMSDVIMKSGKATTHVEELDDPKKFAEAGTVISQQEYVSRLHELKGDITRAWQADDRVTSLKLSIKVARLLTDTSVLQFYPTLFVLATDILDMLGDMVWKRIKQKAEFSEHGNVICSLPENFEAKDISSDAKETCNNWFFKIGSVRELLPRIYLELAILPCWRFLLDRQMDVLQRLVKMTRGIADPLASAYCRLYIAHCAQKLHQRDIGYLISCINDMKPLLMRFLSAEATSEKLSEKSRLLINLMEPSIEYMIKCIIKDSYQTRDSNVLMELGPGTNQSELFGKLPHISVILHHLLKELPSELVSSNAVDILQLIECSKDFSFDQCLNYRLLGIRLSERISQSDVLNAVVDKIIQVASEYNSLDAYLKVIDSYVDIILQNQMDYHLNAILNAIVKLACYEGTAGIELDSLQSIILKLLAHFNNLEDIISLSHFIEILDMMHGSSRSVVNIHILDIATRCGSIRDPMIVQWLFEVSQSLHDGMDYSNIRNDDNQLPARLISRFVTMVDYRSDVERHLSFLVECRGAFGSIYELKETLVHSSNCLAVKAIKDGQKHVTFVKSCIAFSEVTIPSVPSCSRQLHLYLETAEVALMGGLVSHSDGLLDSVIICLQTLDPMDGARLSNDKDGILSLIQKLCSLLVLVPGNPEQGVTYIPRSVLKFVKSQSWMTTRLRIGILCALVSWEASLSQFKLPYHANQDEFLGNDHLFFGDPTYLQELLSLSPFILQNLVDYIMQEPSQVSRGSMALETCNYIASSFNLSQEVLPFVSKLMETAKSCLSSNDKYLQSTMKFVDKFLQTDA